MIPPLPLERGNKITSVQLTMATYLPEILHINGQLNQCISALLYSKAVCKTSQLTKYSYLSTLGHMNPSSTLYAPRAADSVSTQHFPKTIKQKSHIYIYPIPPPLKTHKRLKYVLLIFGQGSAVCKFSEYMPLTKQQTDKTGVIQQVNSQLL